MAYRPQPASTISRDTGALVEVSSASSTAHSTSSTPPMNETARMTALTHMIHGRGGHRPFRFRPRAAKKSMSFHSAVSPHTGRRKSRLAVTHFSYRLYRMDCQNRSRPLPRAPPIAQIIRA